MIKHQRQIETFDAPDSQALRSILHNLSTEIATRLNSQQALPAAVHNSQNQQTSSCPTISSPDRMEMPESMAAANLFVAPELLSSLTYSLQFDMANVRRDSDFSNDALDMINVDWEALALAYDLPSH